LGLLRIQTFVVNLFYIAAKTGIDDEQCLFCREPAGKVVYQVDGNACGKEGIPRAIYGNQVAVSIGFLLSSFDYFYTPVS
jgi:hypothetical protein